MAGKARPSLRQKTLENVMRSNLSQTDKECIKAVFEKMGEEKPLGNKLCVVCGTALPKGGQAKYCDKCRKERRAQKVKESGMAVLALEARKRKNAGTPKPPKLCTVCGKELPQGSQAKYCAECRANKSKKFCAVCGAEIPKGSRAKYCAGCLLERQRAHVKRHRMVELAMQAKREKAKLKWVWKGDEKA